MRLHQTVASIVATLLGLGIWLGLASAATASSSFRLALIADDTSNQSQNLNDTFRRELLALTEGEFEIDFEVFAGEWSLESLVGALESAYADPTIDIVVVTGVLANQVLGNRETFDKPTFLPLVFDARFIGLPRAGRGSGQQNLNYLADDLDFAVDLQTFLSVAPFDRVGLLVDGAILEGIGGLPDEVRRSAADVGVEAVAIPFNDPDGDLVGLIPQDIDAVMIGGLGRASDESIDHLIAGLIDRKIASFSFDGSRMVERGLLTSISSEADNQRLARRAALNVQAVLLGEETADQPVSFNVKRRLFLNRKTARSIDVFPSYDVLIEAIPIGDEGEGSGPRWTLGEVAATAVEVNLDLLAQRYGTDAGTQAIREARSALLPEVSASLNTTLLNSSNPSVSAGVIAKRSTSASVGISQLLWSQGARANIDIQNFAQESREAELERFRLDTILVATVTFLDILRAETQLRVQGDNLELTRANLELAQDRVAVGSATAADVYRWQSQLATARQAAIAAYSLREQTRQRLNLILNRPIAEDFRLETPALDDPAWLLGAAQGRALIDNPRAFRLLANLLTDEAIKLSPELVGLRASINAKDRQLQSAKRSFYSPDVALQGQLDQTLEEDRIGSPSQTESDWSVAVVGSLPLFTGGARKAAVARAELELEQLRTQEASLRQQIEQSVRSATEQANASFLSMPLAQQAVESARKNLELITESYSAGVVSIIDLLDAQSATLQAEENAINSTYIFLIDLLNVQRSIGRFDFFLGREDRQRLREELETTLQSGSHNHD